MTRNGDAPAVPWRLKMDGWLPFCTVPIATPDLTTMAAGITILLDPVEIEVLTADGLQLTVMYEAYGDYADRWVSVRSGRVIGNIMYWRHL